MRFDEIDIIGEFKINGLTGSPGQALGLSGSDFTWITVSASSVIDAVGLTGTDYVICQSVNTGNPGPDAIENGNRLKSAYATASALYVSNRVSVLITPGDYNFDATPLQLTTTKVDLIGISSDASDVILRASDVNSVLGYESGVDSALYNLTLGTSLDIGVSGSGTSYLRWKNVIVSQNSFYNSVYGFENLNGEFEDIKCNNNSNFAKVNGDLNGTFNNIKIGNNTENVFSSNFGGIFGTFSNIEIGDVGNAFSSNSYITGYFKNITTGNVGSIIYSSGQITGEFENITIGNVSNAIYGSTISGTFNNITIGDASYTFYSENNITGTFSNIEVGNVGYLFFSITSDVDGSFKNITSGNVSNYAFSTAGTGNLTGTFENIKTGDNYFIFSIVGSGYINGIFKNIEIGNTTADVLSAESNIIGTFSNIKIGTIQNTAFNSLNGSIYGYFDNIEILEIIGSSFICLTNIDSTIKNLTIGSIGGNFLSPEDTLSGTFSNIKIGYCNSFMSNAASINVNIKDLTVNAVGGDLFQSFNSITGTYENIKIGTCSNAFVTDISDINGYFDTIEIGDVSDSIFSSSGNLHGIYKNIKTGNVTNYAFNGNITDGTFENIESKDISSLFSFNSISGTFSNINGGSIVNAFSIGGGTLYGYYKDITLGTVSNFMACSILDSSVVIDNLKVKSFIGNDNFRGKIINSFVDARGFNAYPIQLSSSVAPTIERCKFLSDISIFSIKSDGFTPNAKISFTITNNEIDGDITNIISDPKNINNPNIT